MCPIADPTTLPRPWVWTGYGVSGAVARAAAAQCRLVYGNSWFEEPPDVCPGRGTVVLVSQSGYRPSALRSSVMVTEHDGDGARLLLERSPIAWLPVQFAVTALYGVAERFGIAGLVWPDLVLVPQTSDVVVFERFSEAARSLLDAAQCKLGYLPFAVCDAPSLGHGLHHGLLARGRVRLVGCQDPWRSVITEWCRSAGVAYTETSAPSPSPMGVLGATVQALAAWAAASSVDITAIPIAAKLDGLRHP